MLHQSFEIRRDAAYRRFDGPSVHLDPRQSRTLNGTRILLGPPIQKRYRIQCTEYREEAIVACRFAAPRCVRPRGIRNTVANGLDPALRGLFSSGFLIARWMSDNQNELAQTSSNAPSERLWPLPVPWRTLRRPYCPHSSELIPSVAHVLNWAPCAAPHCCLG